jgi:spermidine synthase
MPGARRALFGLLFLFSGAAGLIYELVWVRQLYLFFGSTIHSVTTVVAAYMGGLGLGAYLIGRRADRHPSPALLYGVLEIAIGLFGLLSYSILRLVGHGYMAMARTVELGLWPATVAKFTVAFVVLLLPTFLMGGTLPVLTRAFAGERIGRLRRELALFYGLNTVGGVLGCTLAGYVLIEHVGMRTTLLLTGLLNLAVGVAAIAIVRSRALPAEAAAPEPEAEPTFVADPGLTTRRLALWLIGLTAFASLLYEIAWTRVLVLVVGSSTYAFTTVLACFLLGIGLGSLVAVGRGRPPRDLLLLGALGQGGIAVLASLLFPFFSTLPVFIVATLQVHFLRAEELLLLHALVIAAVIVPPALGMGVSFPLLAELAAERRGTTGRETGRAYLANTLGSIAGTVVTGFALIHTLGSERTLVLGVVLNAGAAAVLAWWAWKQRGGTGVPVAVERVPVMLAALALVVAVGTPGWSDRLLDRGPAIYGRDRLDRAQLRSYLRGVGAEQLRFDEGWNAAVSVWRNGNATWLKSNGKSDASSLADMNTQVLVGLLPALAHPAPRTAFVIGLGSGATARAVADVPGMQRLEVVEIERAVVEAASYFEDVNGGVLRDPRVRLIEDDARSALQLTSDSFDLIVSEPSNPWIAGVSSLFTSDFFEVAESRLARGGVFGQWIQTYRVRPEIVAVVVANLRAVFPHVEMWYANPSDLVVLASREPIRWSEARLAAALSPGTATGRTAIDWLRVETPAQFLGLFLLGENGTAVLSGTARFEHTDDRPALEFAAARGLLVSPGVGGVFGQLLDLKWTLRDTLPLLDGWTVAPAVWRLAYARSLPADNRHSLALAEEALQLAPDDAAARGEVGRVLFERSEFRSAHVHLRAALERRPRDGRLLLLSGVATAALGDLPGARELLSRARESGGDSAYASSVLAELAVGERDYATAAAEARRALRALRPTLANPFPSALESAVNRLAIEAPPPLAAPVMELAVATRPSWDLAYRGGALAYARWGGEWCARAAQLAEELTRFGWTTREYLGLLRPCAGRWQGSL